MIHNVPDPKLLKKARPREELVPIKSHQLIEFDGVFTKTGKVNTKLISDVSVYTERLDKNTTSAIYFHPKKNKIVTLIDGILGVCLFIEDSQSITLLKPCESVVIPANTKYSLMTTEGCVLVHSEPLNYETKLKIDDSFVKESDMIEIYKPRYKSKAKAQLEELNPKDNNIKVNYPYPENADLNEMPVKLDDGSFL